MLGVFLASSSVQTAQAAQANPEKPHLYAVAAKSVLPQYSGDKPLPESVDLRKRGLVTAVKDQSVDGTCWAHATLGSIESANMRDDPHIDLSERYLAYFMQTDEFGSGIEDNSLVNGSNAANAVALLSNWIGPVSESKAPYNEEYGDNRSRKEIQAEAELHVTGIHSVPLNIYSPDFEEECIAVKHLLDEENAMYISLNFDVSNSLNYQTSAYYYDPDNINNPKRSSHAVLLVGYDDNYPADNFLYPPKNNGAWLIKNSWGNNNELGGFFWMSYEDKDILSTKYKPSYTVESFEPVTANKKLVQNEIYGATYEFDYLSQQEVTYLNHFEFDKDFDLIDKIIFETTGANAGYTLSFVPDRDGKPSDDQSEWTTLGSGVTDYAGYLCIDIDNFLLPETSGSIAVSLQAAAGKTATIGVGEWLVYANSDDYLFINESEPGMSYLYENGGFTDLMDWYRVNNDDEIGGTFVIKALTLKPETGDVNLDGEVNVLDATLIQRYLAELDALNDRQLSLADVSGDNNVNIADATLIQMNIAEIGE